MGKVNEARGFKTRKPVFSNYDSRWLFALDTAEKVFHPYRLEFRVFTEDKDEFEKFFGFKIGDHVDVDLRHLQMGDII